MPPASDFALRLGQATRIGNRFNRARAIAGIADDLDRAQVSAALDQMARFGDIGGGDERRQIVQNLLVRWGELDPRDALESAHSAVVSLRGSPFLKQAAH